MSVDARIRMLNLGAIRTGGSLAAMAMALAATPALADSSAAPDAGELLGSAGLEVSVQRAADTGTYWTATGSGAPVRVARTVTVSPEPEILIANPGTPTTARDPVNVTGIGQMIVDNGGGSIGLCTGTLVNPRMVIFAAHCVNSRTEGAYGAPSGGTPIAFGFETSTRANAAGQEDELISWLFGRPDGSGRHQTNVARSFYNVNYVNYNPLSLDPNSATFLIADVATASLDTPAANVPTWALLFSQLPAKPIDPANGTGYHVNLAGYGGNGTGTSGTFSIDYRRRIAENTLGALASLDEFENFLFGTASTTNPQNLYWIDFDDPLRGTAGASPYDFNAWRDNALPNEGTTAGGDSGGPLILDREFAKQVLIGVLSGGYTRFYSGAPANGYGTAKFYQPLYLYWDYIVANNPYHYVGSVAGSRNWEDPTHWVTQLDPAYQIIVDGQLVNGLPTTPGQGNTEQPGFGQACFQTSTSSECLDIASGTVTTGPGPIGASGNDAGQAVLSNVELLADGTQNEGGSAGQQASSPADSHILPAPTLANGLPGASNFVPNNYDGDRVNRIAPRYFDVTLGAAGTTTLNSTVVIDRFSMANAGATLDIRSGSSLTSLISVTQMTGTMQVNGALTTPGDYMMLAGGLNGTGTVTTPFFTSLAGTISPGTSGNAGNIGTLTFRGNTIFASGTVYRVDLGAAGVSDVIAVQANGATGGQANVGGQLFFSVLGSATPRAGDTYTILTAQNGVTGTFLAPAAISAILTPTVIYRANAVDVRLAVGSYANVVDNSSAVQTSYAQLMDGNRAGSYGALADLYGPLDMQSTGGIRSFFEAAAPRTETLRSVTGLTATGTTDRFFRQRIHSIQPGEASGVLAVNGNPLPLAAQGSFARASAPVDAGLGFVDDGQTAAQLSEDTSGYLVGGYLNGSSVPMPAAASGGRDTFDGWFVALGFEQAVADNATIGFGLSYTQVDGTTGGAPQQAGSRLAQGTLYGAVATPGGVRMDLRVSAGVLNTRSERTVTLVSTPYTLNLKDDSFAFATEFGVGFDLAKGGNFAVVPRVSLRYESIGFDYARETGGPIALVVDRDTYEAFEFRGGLSLSGKSSKIRPYLEANYVHDFTDRATTFGAGFVGGTAVAPFALAGSDKNWAEVMGGLSFNLGTNLDFSVEADTTVFRSDFRNQSYRGRLTIRF